VYDISAEALGKASAVAASSMEPAANWFNPAQLAFMPGYSGSLGGTFILSSSKFTPEGGGSAVNAKDGFFTLPAVFGHARLTERVALGLGVCTPWGLGVEWPEDWIGREHAIKASIQTGVINLNGAFKLHSRLGLAVGFDVVRGAVDMTNGLPDAVGGGSVRIGGGAWGFGGNAAVSVKAVPEKLHFGLAYRSRVKLSFDGRADFTVNEPIFSPVLQDQGGKAAITIPDIITVGMLFRPRPTLDITFDTNVTLWNTYDEIHLDFERPETPDETLPRKDHAAATFRLGVDWSGAVKGLHLRAGIIYDMNPAPAEYLSPSLPDANRVDVGLGVGYAYKWFKADLGYLLVYFLDSKATGDQSPHGTYSTIAHLMGLTLSFHLDGPGSR